MDRTDREHRHQQHLQSSLPSSLIPHLYSGPQQPRFSQTRTTLQKEDFPPLDSLQSCRVSPLRPVSPSALSFDPHRRQLPPFYLATSDARDRHLGRSLPDLVSMPMRRALDAPSLHESFSNHRLDSRQPLRVDLRSSESYRRTSLGAEQVPPIQDQSEQMRERDSYHPSSNRTWRRDHAPQPDQSHERLPGPSRLLDLGFHEQSTSREKSYESQDSYSTVGSLSVSAVSLSGRDQSPDSVSLRRAISRSFDATSNDGDGAPSKGKRRREESVEASPNPEKTTPPSQRGMSKKTAVACNFCRGRKLRCNGDRPKCYNCGVRNFECEYVPIQRRRGPGKAPKGSRSKKVASGRPGSSSKAGTDRPSNMIAEHELEALAPEVRPYMSVLSLSSFGFHLPSSYPPMPKTMGGESSHHHARRRSSRNPETSSWEARSDAERNP